MSSINEFIKENESQLRNSGVPEIYWPALFKKINEDVYDAGQVFEIAKIDYTDTKKDDREPGYKLFVTAEDGLTTTNPQNIFLIDHALVYEPEHIRKYLSHMPGLLDRLCSLMSYDVDDIDGQTPMDFVLEEIWRYNQSFTINCLDESGEETPVWYIMDEVGSSINHSDKPNFRTVPFMHKSKGSYSLLFPVQDVACGDEVTRDFVENLTNDPDKRRVLLLPWFETDFTTENFIPGPSAHGLFETYCLEKYIPDDTEVNPSLNVNPKIKSGETLRVYTEDLVVEKSLQKFGGTLFEIVDNSDDCDILWLTKHYLKYKFLLENQPHVFINQFPCEHLLTFKDMLAISCRRRVAVKFYDCETLETFPEWLPTTYVLSTELVPFASYFQKRDARGLDNHWICKPRNLARGMGIYITKNLNQILRLVSTRPYIAQKYVDKPVLYTRPDVGNVKFDVRYVVLLKSVKPLKAYVHSNFFLRFANKPFVLDNLDDYEQHFTVMNYEDSVEMYHLKCEDFIPEWRKMYPDDDWIGHVEPKILHMIRETIQAVSMENPPEGLAHNPQSRALYAVDLMLEWRQDEIQPVLLEVNFAPDNNRACEYYPKFYLDIFKLLFLNIENHQVFHKLV